MVSMCTDPVSRWGGVVGALGCCLCSWLVLPWFRPPWPFRLGVGCKCLLAMKVSKEKEKKAGEHRVALKGGSELFTGGPLNKNLPLFLCLLIIS
jgi:hypothetical protein